MKVCQHGLIMRQTWYAHVNTRVMNVWDSSIHGDTPMCQKWYANVEKQKSYRLDTNLQRQTELFLYTPELRLQGIMTMI